MPGAGQGESFPLLAPDGTVAAPSYAFSGAGNSGVYRTATAEVAVAVAGAARLIVGSSGVKLGTQLIMNNQPLSNPSIVTQGRTTSGTESANFAVVTNGTTAGVVQRTLTTATTMLFFVNTSPTGTLRVKPATGERFLRSSGLVDVDKYIELPYGASAIVHRYATGSIVVMAEQGAITEEP